MSALLNSIFEDALARVSQQLAAAARRSAAELKAERIAASRRNSSAPRERSGNARNAWEALPTSQTLDRSPNWPALRKRQASTLATGARHQAKKNYRQPSRQTGIVRSGDILIRCHAKR